VSAARPYTPVPVFDPAGVEQSLGGKKTAKNAENGAKKKIREVFDKTRRTVEHLSYSSQTERGSTGSRHRAVSS
jgi:hypothetical protein